ncbi:RNase H domain-containing protein [Trichonephila clavipes]|nr:RNase H domain-containing protein [Trichonephila clavipes]
MHEKEQDIEELEFPSHIDLEGNEIADTLAKAGACEVPEPSAPLTFLEIFSRTKHQNRTTWITLPQSTIAGHTCSHPRVPGAHQAGSSRRSLAGVGLTESVRCHGLLLSSTADQWGRATTTKATELESLDPVQSKDRMMVVI